jgi:hypothetical protein
MLTLGNFFDSFRGKLAERWVATILSPAFVYWGGVVAAWTWKHGWNELRGFAASMETVKVYFVLTILFIAIAASAAVVEKIQFNVLQQLEGYWPSMLKRVSDWRVKSRGVRISSIERRFQVLAALADKGHLSTSEGIEFGTLDQKLHFVPSDPRKRMPTKLGDILRNAETRPESKYGLNAVICWPRLWLLLPDGPKADFAEARKNLDGAARAWCWSILFVPWAWWAWWAAPAGIIGCILAYRWMVDAATTYSELIESAFDVHRSALYKALRWPLPGNAREEVAVGMKLTEYLWRGSHSPSITLDAKRG